MPTELSALLANITLPSDWTRYLHMVIFRNVNLMKGPAALLVWLMESRPRADEGLGAVVNRSINSQSLVGWVREVPAQRRQE